ncbi:MAG: glycosyltransferase family 2 protein [Paraglaciecola sp.]|nr:glycosyltransferase family 2 protein [Paraglaciecola sp.]
MILFDGILFFILMIAVFFCAQLLLGLFKSHVKVGQPYRREPCVILIPAHNEEGDIGKNLQAIKSQIEEGDKILVVADNCSDNTAAICRNENVMVIERTNTMQIGKGYALQYGVDHIKSLNQSWRTIVVMDADCQFTEGSLNTLVAKSQSLNRVVQALYLMKSPDKLNIKLNISEFTWLIKNWVRPLGLKKMGISCHLQGSGMAFPLTILNKYSLASGSIVEDLELGLKIVDGGDEILFLPEATVLSYFPTNEEGLAIQRKRWEHGHMSIVAKMPKVMFDAIRHVNPKLFFQALDASIPPTIIWMFFLTSVTFVTFVLGFFISFHWLAYYAITSAVFTLLLMLCWFRFGKTILPVWQLKGMLPFVLSKFGIYKSFVSNREKAWVKTKRDK